MGFFSKLSSLFGTTDRTEQNVLWVYARCNRCSEVLECRVNLANDLSIKYGEEGQKPGYICRKLISGDGKNLCFQVVEINLQFDDKRKLVNREISGGVFVDKDAFTEQQESQV